MPYSQKFGIGKVRPVFRDFDVCGMHGRIKFSSPREAGNVISTRDPVAQVADPESGHHDLQTLRPQRARTRGDPTSTLTCFDLQFTSQQGSRFSQQSLPSSKVEIA